MTHACDRPFSLPLPRAATPWWHGALRAWRRWRSLRAQAAAQRHVDEALAQLPAHLLRDIGAPEPLIAQATAVDARPCCADVELRA